MAIDDIISKTKAEQKQAQLDAASQIRRREELEEIQKIKDIQNKSNEENTNKDNSDIDLPLSFKYKLGEEKDASYREVDKKTDAQIFSNNQDNIAAKQINELEGKQAQELLDYETQKKYTTDILAPFFSTKQSDYYNRYSQAVKLDQTYDYQSQIGIPLSVKQSNETADLKTKLANQKAIATANFIKQQINDDISYIADNYKQYTEEYIKQNKKSGFIYTEKFNQAWENAYKIATNKISEATQTSGPLDNFIRSFIRYSDMSASLGATLAASFREKQLTFEESNIMERLLESMFNYKSFNAHQAFETADLWRGGLAPTLRALPIANGIATLAESSFDILALGISAAPAIRALNNTVLEARNGLLVEGILTRNMSKHIDRQIKIAQREGKDQLVSQLNKLKTYMVGPNAKGPLVGELAAIGGAVAATFNKSSFFNSLKRYPGHYVVSGAFMANEYAKRAVDLYKDKPDNYQLSFFDAMTPLIHIAVDYAGLVSALGAKNLFVGAKGSLLNKREMAKLAAKKELTDAEKTRLAVLQAENKTKWYDGLLGGIVTAAGVEGFGEMIQTHLEQQVRSGFTLPSLTEMLYNNYRNENLRRQQQEMYMTGALGAIGGVAMAVPAQIGGNLLSSRAEQYRYAREVERERNPNIEYGNSALATSQEELSKLQDDFDRAVQRIERLNGNSRSKEDIRAESTKKIGKLKSLEEDIEKKTEELNKDLANEEGGHQIETSPIKQNNTSKIQQLEYIKSKLDESSESVKKIEELIKKYKDLDNSYKSMHEAIMMEDIITNEENVADKTKARTAFQKLLTFNPEEHKDSTQALRDIEKEVFDSINKTTADVKSLLEFLDTKRQSTLLSVDESQKIDSEVVENKTPNKNSKKDTDKNVRYETTDNTNTNSQQPANGTNNQPQGQPQGQPQNADANATQAQQQTDTVDTQNIDNQTQQRDITELTDEEINEMTQKDINDLFSTISPDVGMFIMARTRERNRNTTVSPEENAGYKAMKSMYSVIRVPYSYLEGDREGVATTIGRSSESVFKFNDRELLLVSKNFYDAESRAISSVTSDSSIVSPMQRALNSLSSINSETYSGMIQELENLIDNNAEQSKIDEKADEIANHFRENVTIVGRHMILLNAVVSSNPNSPLAKQIRLNANIAAKTLKEIKNKMEKLNKDLNINIEINEEFDNSITGIMDSIHTSTLSIFNRIKNIYRERNSLEPNKEESNDNFKVEHDRLTKTLKRALKAFQGIAKSLTKLFSDEKFIQTYENTLTLLEQGNSALMANLGFKTNLNINVNGKTEKLAINGVTNLAEMYFYDILYNTFNIKEYGIDSKMILLDKILSKLFIDKDGKKELDIDLVNTLNYFRDYFEDIKITIPLKITQYANERIAGTHSSNVKNVTFSLNDLINGNNNVFKALLPNKITELSVGNSSTLDQLIETHKGELRAALAEILTNKNNEIRKEIINRLSIQVAINEPLSNALDTVLKIGLLAESYTFLKSKNERTDDTYHYKNPSDFQSTRRAFIRTLLGETEDSDVNNSQAMNALVEMSTFLATSYMESKTMDGKNQLVEVITEKGNTLTKVHNSLMTELGKHDQESFDSWIRINDNQNEAFNDFEQLKKIFDTFADRVGIRMSDRRAMMLNLQLTGKVLYSSEEGPNGDKQRAKTELIFLKIIGKTIQDAYDEVSKNLYQLDNNGNMVFNAENSISSSRYNSLKNTFIDNLQRDRNTIATYKAIINKIHSGTPLTGSEQNILKDTPLVYVPIIVKQYDEHINQIREEVRYVYSPSLSIMNKQVSDQILVTNTKTNALETLFALKDSSTITEVLGTIEGRLQSIGYGAFKLFNSYENAKKFPTKYFVDKIDYSKNTYYLSDLLPNGRIANKISNTEQDNKLLREITNYVLPKNIFYYDDKEKDPANRLKTKPNTDALQWSGKSISSITADKVSHNGEYSDDYYGLLYSLAMTFGVDFDKIKLKNPKNQTAFNNRIKKLNKLHNEILKLEDKYKKENDAVKKAKLIQDLGDKVNKLNNEYIKLFNDYEIDYMYKFKDSNGNEVSESLTELLNGLLRDDQTAKDKFNQLWAIRKQESMNVFTEHPGITIKNGSIFLDAVNSNNFIQNIQTQDLVVYADGKATFSAQNSVRMKGIPEIDALSGIARNNSDVDIKANIGFIKEQAILQDLKKEIEKLASKNGDFKNYLKILEEKGIDAYTSAIGPTILTMRALSHSNTLLTSLYSEELLNRDLIKKPTQAPSYGQWVSSVLAGYIETVKIPFNRALAEFFDTSSFFNSVILSNGKTVRETMVSINDNQIEGQNLEQLKNEIANAFESSLNEEIIKLEKKKKKNKKLTEFEETKYQLLKGLENYLKDSKTNTLYMLFGRGFEEDKHKGIFNDIKEEKGKVDFTALSDYFFNEETGVLYQDKNTITKYYENFDVVQVTDDKKNTKTIKITRKMIDNANEIIDLINKDHKNRSFFKSMEEVWFQGLLNDDGVIKSNDYFNVKFDNGILIITTTDELNNKIAEIKGKLGFEKDENLDIRSILVNTAHFYVASQGSFLPNHKPLAQRANPALAIVQQNNSYIQKQKELIEDNLIIVLDQAMDKILEDAYRRIKGNETKEFNDEAKAELQKAYRDNQTITDDNGKKMYISDYIRDKKNKVVDKFFREVYGDFWSKSNRNLYIQIFKKHPSLDDKTRFSQMINKQKSILDNSLEQLLKHKIQLGPNHATTTLSDTKGIMSNVIGQFNHPFEALLVIAMNNPTTQVFDAYIGNANNIVRFMDTWNRTLASESGANVDSAVILNNFNNSIRESMIKALTSNGISAINNMNTEIDNAIKNKDKEKILNRVNFLLNVLRHIVQLSSGDNIMANNAVGIHTIKNIDSSSFSQYNRDIFELREKAYKEIKDILQKLEEQGLTNFKKELEKRIDYNILNEEDINIKDITESTDVKDLSYHNSRNFMNLITDLLKTTLKLVIDVSGANSPINVIRKFVENKIVKKQILSRQHQAFYDNRKTNLIDINFGSILSDEIINNDIDKIIDIIKKAYPNLDADKISQLILKDDNNMYSINDIVNALLNYDIHLKIDSATNSQTSLDSNLIENIKSKISYDDLVIKANKIGSTKVKIDGLNITIDIKSTVNKELKYIVNIFKTINTMNPNLYKGSLEKLNKDIENNSIRGINTILVNQKSLSGNEVVMGSIHRLTPATATANVLLKLQNSEYSTNGTFYNSKVSKIYYNLFVSPAQHQINQQHINNYRKNNPQTNNTQTNQQQANNTTTNANNATNATNVQNNTPNANQQATNAPQQQPTQQQQKQKTKKRRPDSDYILADGDNLPIDDRDDSSKVEQSVQQYQKDMNEDLDAMKKDNKDIAEEITMVTSLINSLIANFKKGIKFFKSGVNSGYRGEYNVDDNEIVIYGAANRGTRAHEFIHAGLTFAFDNISNETAYLISQISNLHNEVRAYIESIPESERESFIQNIFGDSPNPSARYDYVFGQSTDHNLQEFVSVFLTSPRLIRFLASKEFSDHLTRIPEFDVEAKTRLGKAIKYVPILIGYTFKLIMSRFKEQNRNGLNILTTAVSKLSKYNTEEGQLSEQEAYDRRIVTRTNKAVRGAVLTITKNVEHYITKMKALDPNYNADREVAEIEEELNEKVKSIANDVREIRALNSIANLRKTGRFVRHVRTGIWLIQSIYYSRLGLRKLMENPIKAQIVANVMQELRQAAVEGTLLDTRIQMDFGISTTKFLKNFVNSVNRALGFRTELDMQKEVAASNISKQVSIILGKPKYIAEKIANDTKDKKFYKAYSEGANKIIVHQNLGDYFFGDEMVNQDELNTLVDFALNDNEETNQKIIQTRNAKVASAMRALGLEENGRMHKAIAKIVDSMGITRITDKKNSLGSQNIEQMLRELGVDFKNDNIKSALKELHQAITLSAIIAPRIYNRADFEYIKDKTYTFRRTYADPNLKYSDRAEIRESIKELITLHKSKLDGLYKQRQLKFKDKGVQALLNKTKLDDMYYTDMSEMYEEVSAFEYMTDAAYYSDSYKPSEYNQSVTIVNLDPMSENFQEQKDALLKKGFKMENKSQLTGIETFKYDGLVNLNNGKDRRGFMYRANTHKGNVIQYLSEEDVDEMKVEAREKYKSLRKDQILNYGNDYTFDGHYIFDSREFYELGDTKSFAGSETMTRDNISIKQLEEWTGMDTSIESAFRSMERTIQDNVVRNMNNNLIWQQVLLANEEIERRESKGVNHHSEILFRIGADENGEVRVTFNHSLKEFYGFELTRQDETDFAKFYKAMNNGNLPANSTIKIDSRMVGMLFGYDLPTFTKSIENNPIRFKIGRAIEGATRFLVKESRNNTIIRNPNLVWENLKSNIIGLVGEGVPFIEIMEVFPYYVKQLNKYQKDMREKVRIANEIVIKEKQEYRDKAGITADQQKREVDRLKRQLEIIDEDLKKNAVAPLMGQGLYTNIVEDAETQGFKWDQKLLELVDKTDKLSKEQIAYINELFMTESSDAYQTLAYLTRIGDFIPRVILYHHIMGKGRQIIDGKLETREQTHRRALDEARDRFINYNTPIWSPILRKLDRFGFTNYAKYAFSVEKQIAKVFVKAPVQATTIVGIQLGLDAMGVSSVLKPSSYLTESFIFDHKLPSGFINPFTPTDTFIDSLNRWNYVTPNLKF